MNRSTIFGIKIDFQKSHDSYLFDKNRNKHFLDFFGMYSTIPLGYSHPVFKSRAFVDDVLRSAHVKVTNCEIASEEVERFTNAFETHPAMKPFSYFYYCCTGALAVEAAIKTAILKKKCPNPHVIALQESFHGINSYGAFLSDRTTIAAKRLEGLPTLGWSSITNPIICYRDGAIDHQATGQKQAKFMDEFTACIASHGSENIAALIVEPIQATAGDNYFPQSLWGDVRALCDKHDIALVFDEVQTGVGSTGKMWYFEHLGIIPDIVVFAKKAQTAGIMVRESFGAIFETPSKLEVTWDSTIMDMIRGYYVLKAYEEYKILANICTRSDELYKGLSETKRIINTRRAGSLFAFDFEDGKSRDLFRKNAFENGLLFNPTAEKSVRLRPNLAVTSKEVQEALRIIQNSV